MVCRKIIYYTDADKELMWNRWQAGDSLQAIANLSNCHHTSIQGILVRFGGIRPPKSKRSRFALSMAKPEEISRGIVTGCNRSPTESWTEIRRLAAYRAIGAG